MHHRTRQAHEVILPHCVADQLFAATYRGSKAHEVSPSEATILMVIME